MSLAIADLREGNRIAVRCAHGNILAVVQVSRAPSRLRPSMRVTGTALLPSGSSGEQVFNSLKLLGMPWGVSWRTMSHFRGASTTPPPAKCGCDFFLPTPL
ncbi:MAG TPA: hypothetical protein VJM32_03250 [Candidatus Saccharimonadales bacterium]|nr:hypothetical protein [Candidatus Saccharimonadales bacterium]